MLFLNECYFKCELVKNIGCKKIFVGGLKTLDES